MAEVYPKQHYLLDRYNLLEHLYAGAVGLPEPDVGSVKEWVETQVSHIDQGEVTLVIAT